MNLNNVIFSSQYPNVSFLHSGILDINVSGTWSSRVDRYTLTTGVDTSTMHVFMFVTGHRNSASKSYSTVPLGDTITCSITDGNTDYTYSVDGSGNLIFTINYSGGSGTVTATKEYRFVWYLMDMSLT